MKWITIVQVVLAGMALQNLSASVARGADDSAAPASQPVIDQAALDKKFEKTLTNATLVGVFTTDGDNSPPKQDRYTIARVQKLKGDNWLFSARIQFGQKDVTVPLTLPVKWAGDTPVISVTDLFIPGIGTYTARVVIYNDHYAGTWSGSARHGGAMAGRIEHAEPKPDGEGKNK